MQMYVVTRSDEGKTLRIGLKDSSTTLVEPLIQELNADKDVVYSRYIEDHPDLDDPYLEIKVSSGTPEAALKRAAEAVAAYFSKIKE
ncbi:MAG: DNA-directed RNA polymerase subunit L [Methanomethylophilus alvi]|nr:MAG: DNA-directed RNA polymerase subunit L [Methanomethylophilus alvi]